MLGFLLESMQYVNPPSDLHRIHCPVSILVEPQANFEDPAANAPEWLGGGRFIALLRIIERHADALPHFLREVSYLPSGVAQPSDRPDVLVQTSSPI